MLLSAGSATARKFQVGHWRRVAVPIPGYRGSMAYKSRSIMDLFG
jgi:hypothetical protein